MVLMAGPKILSALTGAVVPRSQLVIYGMQLVSRGNVRWARKAAWFRNPPYTAINPTKMQAVVRVAFGEFMQRYGKGKTGVVETDIGPLPAPAAELHNRKAEFRELIARYAAAIGATKKTVKARRTLHTKYQLAEKYGIPIGGAPPAPGAVPT